MRNAWFQVRTAVAGPCRFRSERLEPCYIWPVSPGTLPQDPAGSASRSPRHRAPAGNTAETSFRRLWLSHALDEAGKPVATLGLSVTAVVVLDVNAGQMGVLTALTQAAYLVFALPAGVWVDRARKRGVLVAAALLRALALAAALLAHLTGTLTLAHLWVLAAVLATAGVFVDTAQGALLPLLVGRERVSEAQSRLQAVDSVVQAAGPGLTGLALARLAPPLLFAVSALTSLACALAASRIPADGDARAGAGAGARRAFWPELVTGVRFTFRQPALRVGALASAANNLGAGMVMTVGPLFVMRDLGLSPTVYAISGSVGALGALAASFAAVRLVRRVGEVRLWTWCYYARPAVFLVLPVATLAPLGTAATIAVVLAGEVAFAFVFVATAVTAAGVRAQVTPLALMGRVGSATRFLAFGVLPIGALLGGWLGGAAGHRAALLAAAAAALVGLAVVALSPLRSLRRVPEVWAREAARYDETVADARRLAAESGRGGTPPHPAEPPPHPAEPPHRTRHRAD